MLVLHRAERSTALVRALSDILLVPQSDPFAPEIIAVPAKGIERWLGQQLSSFLGVGGRNDGIAANIEFPSPNALVQRVITSADEGIVDSDQWAPERLLWSLIAVIDDCVGEPWASVLAAHLGRGDTDHRSGRRYATAAHLTNLFVDYGNQRPEMLIDWAGGRDTDGAGSLVADDVRWQPELWRRLRSRIGTPSPAERLSAICDRVRSAPELLDLPNRLSLFGATRLASFHLEVLAAIGANHDVHLWITHPSPVLWDSTVAPIPGRRRAEAVREHSIDRGSPLLASLGRDVREMQARLASLDATEVHHGSSTPSGSLLRRMQADISSNCVPQALGSADGSFAVHACHGPPRQVEVLRECLLRTFEDDSTLEPRDVVVMCPDIETYAPLIRASFGRGDSASADVVPEDGISSVHPGHRLRVRLADRGLKQTNPVLSVVETLLGLADGRVKASEVLDLANTLPVRARFLFDDDDISRMREWTAESGARWGVARRQRAEFGLADFPQNTFVTGMDRILLGVSADESENEWLDLALPLDDVDSNDIDLVGRFSEFLDRVAVVLRDLHGPRTPQGWVDVILRALDLLASTGPSDGWQLVQARTELARAIAGSEGLTEVRIGLADVRAMLAELLAGRPTRANFRTGELTMCTMVPMRSVPHRVVVLLGLDDDVFPRGGTTDGDDVLLRDPLVGERDPRSEDRQLLLDAVMAAEDKLIVVYTGADPVTGAVRPPAVPLGELIDTAERSILAHSVSPGVSNSVVTRHPLQPFDARNFRSGAPFSFDRSAFSGALARRRTPLADDVFLHEPLPMMSSDDVYLDDLIAFFLDPTAAFLRQRLGIRIPEVDEEVRDSLDVVLDPLSAWGVGERMLSARLSGVSRSAFRATEWRRGTLPPFVLGSSTIDDIERIVEALVTSCAGLYTSEPRTIDVSVDLGNGRRLSGTVTSAHGDTMMRTSYSRLAPKHRLAAWVTLLAGAGTGENGPTRAVVTGRGAGRRLARSTLTVPEDPLTFLRNLVDVRDRGLAAPAPIATGATAVFAERITRGYTRDEAMAAAAAEWGGMFGDGQDRHVAYVYGSAPGLTVLTEEKSKPDEMMWAGEENRFAAFAQRVWTPLLGSEDMTQP